VNKERQRSLLFLGGTMSRLVELEQAIHAESVEIWHHIHQNPELSMAEFKTADYLEKILRETTKVDQIKRVGQTGLWVELRGAAAGPGKDTIVALRGDMDALPIQEQNDLPYRSQVPGVMHACGHDVHTTSLLGAVRVLEHYRDQIPGRVWFFFQPGEETLQGAVSFLRDPAIDFTKIKTIAGIHVTSSEEAGKVALKEGPMLAGANTLKFVITGAGAHAASPHKGRDPITAAAALILQLQTLVSRELNPVEPGVLSLCLIRGGNKDNIIASEVVIEGTLRTLSKETRDYFFDAINRVCQGVALSMRVSVDLKIADGSPPLINDETAFNTAASALKKIVGPDNLVFAKAPDMGGEDFTFYLEKVPGVFILIGARSKGGKMTGMHTAEFYTDEDALRTGTLALSGFALEAFGLDF
jgi:amidohydrolase/hippurate hydrolase